MSQRSFFAPGGRGSSPATPSCRLGGLRGSRGRLSRGFTLIEILVVLVLVGVVMGMTMLNLAGGSKARELDAEVRRVHALMRMAADEALFTDSDYGFRFIDSGYEFLVFDDVAESWQMASGESLKRRELPDWVEMEIEADGEKLDVIRPSNKKEEILKPQMVFFSSTESTPFTVRFSIEGEDIKPYTLSSDGLNAVALETP